MTSPPSLDDLTVCTFAAQDLEHALSCITKAIQEVRKKPHWKSSELSELKAHRAILHPFLQKARSDGLTPYDHAACNKALTAAARVSVL